VTTPAGTLTADSLRAWLIERVAFYLDRPADEIRSDVFLADYGMDSVYAISIISDIEDHLQFEVDPAVARDYPTIDGLTHHLLELAEAANQ
jgi:acyl carrier protein